MQRFDLEIVAEIMRHLYNQMVVLICEIFFTDLAWLIHAIRRESA